MSGIQSFAVFLCAFAPLRETSFLSFFKLTHYLYFLSFYFFLHLRYHPRFGKLMSDAGYEMLNQLTSYISHLTSTVYAEYVHHRAIPIARTQDKNA